MNPASSSMEGAWFRVEFWAEWWFSRVTGEVNSEVFGSDTDKLLVWKLRRSVFNKSCMELRFSKDFEVVEF